MISQIGIDRSAEVSHLKRRLCDGAPRVEMPLKVAATSRLETRGDMSCGSDDVARADDGAALTLCAPPEAPSLAPQRRQNLSRSRRSTPQTSHSQRSLVSTCDRS